MYLRVVDVDETTLEAFHWRIKGCGEGKADERLKGSWFLPFNTLFTHASLIVGYLIYLILNREKMIQCLTNNYYILIFYYDILLLFLSLILKLVCPCLDAPMKKHLLYT